MTNLLTGQPWYAGLGGAVLTGAVIGGIAGGVGYKIRQIMATARPVNSRALPYPDVEVPGYGKVPYPEGPYTPHNPGKYQELRSEFRNTVRPAFEQWWKEVKGLPWPTDAQYII